MGAILFSAVAKINSVIRSITALAILFAVNACGVNRNTAIESDYAFNAGKSDVIIACDFPDSYVVEKLGGNSVNIAVNGQASLAQCLPTGIQSAVVVVSKRWHKSTPEEKIIFVHPVVGILKSKGCETFYIYQAGGNANFIIQ